MSAFKVDSAEIRAFANSTLATAVTDASAAKSYLATYGDFTFYDAGAIGYLAGSHQQLMDNLTSLVDRVRNVLEHSEEALRQIAAGYDHTDQRAAAKVDATYPEVPRPPVSKD